MGIGSPEQETKSSEVLNPVNSDPKLDAYSENMAEATTNGHLANHVNNIDSAFNISAQANEHIREHKKEHKSTSENKHRDSNHSSSSKHHSSSPGSSKHHSSSSSKHHSSSSSKHSSSSSSKHHSSSSSKHHSSSSSKHHSSSSSSKDPSKHPSKHSSSSSKDPSRHSSSKDSSKHSSSSKHHSSSSKDPSKHHSSSSSKHHSSSSKHKDGSSKHKDRSSSSSSHKHHSSDKPIVASPSQVRKESLSPEPLKIKPESMSPTKIKAESVSPMKIKIKHEVAEDSDDDMPLSARLDKVKSEPKPEKVVKRTLEDSEDDEPLSAKLARVSLKMKEESQEDKKSKKRKHDDEDFEPAKKKKKNREPPKVHVIKSEKELKKEAREAKKLQAKKKEEETKWKWWEEDENAGHSDGTFKWKSLQHMGPVLAPAYEPLPDHVRFFHKGKQMRLSEETEEVATFYGRMLDHDYTTKEVFNRNFLKDWRKVMTSEERERLTDLSQCDFREILTYFKEQTEKRKAMTKEEKNVIKEQNAATVEEYGFCIIDGHKQKIGNFRVEPPGLFRGRGDHPKQGMLKKRTHPRDIIINCSKGATVPQPPYSKWKEVRHDNTVTWLACWCENIQGSTKYVMLNAASKLKGEKDWKKYETARELHKHADKIRAVYREDWRSKEMRIRQRSVAMYFIDKLALRAGNEKDEDQADTVGCCSLRVEHINLHEKFGNEEFVVEFDFLGKDSIRYYNKVSVEKRVFKNLQLFKENKNEGDDLFDRLNTSILNKYLQGLMDGLTAKVFRTYNASKTLQEQLDLLTAPDDPLTAKVLSYNRANRAVAVLCNHQRAVPKNFSQQMENIQSKIDAKKEAIHDAKKDVKKSKSDYKALKTELSRKLIERRKKTVERLEEQLIKLEVLMTDKDENKEIALGTSKLNYLDPRISVAWCKKWEVPVEKVYNKTQREKFAWAIDMAEDDFRF